MQFVPGSQVAAAYGQAEAVEDFRCNYGFNAPSPPGFKAVPLPLLPLTAQVNYGLWIHSPSVLYCHPVLPQMRSQPGQPHPLILAYVQAARGRREKAF